MFTLHAENASSCQIVIPAEPTPTEQHAAQVLQDYLHRIIDVELAREKYFAQPVTAWFVRAAGLQVKMGGAW